MKTKDEWRYHYAGQILAAIVIRDWQEQSDRIEAAVEYADALLAELERTAPKELRMRDLKTEIEERMECLRQLNCDHAWHYEGLVKACNKCGAFE